MANNPLKIDVDLSKMRAPEAIVKEIISGFTGQLEEMVDVAIERAKAAVPRDTGNLADNIHYELTRDGDDGLIIRFFTATGYGGWVEIGTSRMVARPYIGPAIKEAMQELERAGAWN